MKLVVFIVIFSGVLTGALVNPVFVMAKSTCYVDKDAKDDGDGSKEEPYKKISKALDKECKKITVDKGTYKNDITLGKGVKITGKNRDSVIITGKVVMKDGSELDKVTVSGSGIDVAKNADVDIENSKIKNANIGIETLGNGTLTVDDTSLSGNRKAMYLQKGKNVKITGCKVYDNDEEGIDIRSNVDGIIRGNEIYNNGESGIEVILGKSDLRIENNSIKKNRASGIAAQYYTHASKFGGVQITGNKITGNKSYGLNCKAPSGGSPGQDYWSSSMQLTGNNISGNKEGEFSASCFLGETIISDATKTEEEKEQEQKEKIEKQQKQQEIAQQEKESEELKLQQEKEEQERLEQEKKQQEEQKKEAIRQELATLKNIQPATQDVQNAIQKRPEMIMLIIGPDQEQLQKLSDEIAVYDQNIMQVTDLQQNVEVDEELKKTIDQELVQLQEQREELQSFVQNYENKFSLYKWISEHKIW